MKVIDTVLCTVKENGDKSENYTVIENTGNLIEDCTVIGSIETKVTAPDWNLWQVSAYGTWKKSK